jgi:hypothetical protein
MSSSFCGGWLEGSVNIKGVVLVRGKIWTVVLLGFRG